MLFIRRKKKRTKKRGNEDSFYRGNDTSAIYLIALIVIKNI